MRTRQIKRFLIGLFVALMLPESGFAQTATAQQSPSVVKGLSEQKLPEQAIKIYQAADSPAAVDEQDQAPNLIDLEMLTRAENRLDALRAQLLDVQMREIDLQSRVDDLDYRMRPENIQEALALVGSARPMDELREDLRARLESEKTRTNAQLDLLASTRARLEAAIRDANAECVRLRARLRLRWSDGCPENDGATPGDGESSSPPSRR